MASLTGSPQEHAEQCGLIQLAEMLLGRYPELELLYANPNAGKRTFAMANFLKAEGWKKGIPDLTLPVARKGYHGLYLEMKRQDGVPSDVTTEQDWWIDQLSRQDYYAVWCRGAAHAWQVLQWYLDPVSTKGVDIG